MKNLIFVILLFVTTLLSAQIVHEQTFEFSGNLVEISEGEYKIYIMDDVNNQCRIYNTDYSLWKTISLNVPDGKFLYNIKFVSKNLFNTDDNIELLYIVSEYIDASYYEYTIIVADETGTELLNVPKGVVSKIIATGDNSKLVIWTYDYSSYPYVVSTKFYSVVGNIPNFTEENNKDFYSSLPYPVPATNSVTIPYTLNKKTETAELKIFDTNANEIEKFIVDGFFNKFILNTTKYKNGIYFYKIKNKTGKFIISF